MALKNMGNLQIASTKKLEDFVLANQWVLKECQNSITWLKMNFIQQSIIFQDH